jgi:hypothetical protein
VELSKTKRHLVVLRYEDMRAAPGETLRRIAVLVGCDASGDDIAHALQHSSLENMRKLEAENDPLSESRREMPNDLLKPDAFKARRGNVGGYRESFTTSALETIDAYLAVYPSPLMAIRVSRMPRLSLSMPRT